MNLNLFPFLDYGGDILAPITPGKLIRCIRVTIKVKPIINQLCIIFKDENLIEEQLNKISSLLEGKTSLVVGYAQYNLKNLLAELKSQKVNLRNLSDR